MYGEFLSVKLDEIDFPERYTILIKLKSASRRLFSPELNQGSSWILRVKPPAKM